MDSAVAVKVAVRVRPLIDKEKLSNQQSCTKVISQSKQIVMGKDRAFNFDYVFSPQATQLEIYNTCVKDLVKGLFDGYNATVFAYGQTGSGKTYTVGGSGFYSDDDPETGIIPRAMKYFFDLVKQNKHGRNLIVKASYIEIYQEDLRDLLFPETSPKDLQIREVDGCQTIVSGVKHVLCQSYADVNYCLKKGSLLRQTGATGMNEQSSRSHSIFTVYLDQQWTTNPSPEQPDQLAGKCDDEEAETSNENYMCAKFHFVDLAGSERAHRTKNVGDRFKESVHINSGLLALGNVISALTDPKRKSTGHVPYRDSKITRLLKDSLGGNSNTLMLACISPALCNFDESLNTLNYAGRARHIRNQPVINRDPESQKFEALHTEIQVLKAELERQKTALAKAGGDELEGGDDEQILRDKIDRLARSCSHYRYVSKETWKYMTRLQAKNVLPKSFENEISKWSNLMENAQSFLEEAKISDLKTSIMMPDKSIDFNTSGILGKIDVNNGRIAELESEIGKLNDHLKFDEEIFSERQNELEALRSELNRINEEKVANERSMTEVINKYESEILAKQITIDKLTTVKTNNAVNASVNCQDSLIVKNARPRGALNRKSVTNYRDDDDDEEDDDDDEYGLTNSLPTTPGPGNLARPTTRAKSVPTSMVQHKFLLSARPVSRHIHTSPALFSVERVMQGFRARVALISSQIDDLDCVAGNRKLTQIMESAGVCENDGRGDERGGDDDDDEIRKSVEVRQKSLAGSDLKSKQFNEKIHDLDLNIKLKEQLIRDLVKTGRQSVTQHKQYETKIQQLVVEKGEAQEKIKMLTHNMEQLSLGENNNKIKTDYEHQLESYRSRLATLKRRQRELEKQASTQETNDRKLSELKLAVANMKQQQVHMHKKLKLEQESKIHLEKELTKDQHKLKLLQQTNKQQSVIIKQKTGEAANLRKRLASAGREPNIPQDDEMFQWMTEQIRNLALEKKKLSDISTQLEARNDLLEKKSSLISDKHRMEIKNLRKSCSQQPLEDVQQQIDKIDNKLKINQGILNDGDEHDDEQNMAQLGSAIDSVNEALNYANETLVTEKDEKKVKISKQFDSVVNRLSGLSGSEARNLLIGIFNQTVELKEKEEAYSTTIKNLQENLAQKDNEVNHLKHALHDVVLVGSSTQLPSQSNSDEVTSSSKLKQIQKELFYYKKTSRDLRLKLQQQQASFDPPMGAAGDGLNASGISNITLASSMKQSDAFKTSRTNQSERISVRNMVDPGIPATQIVQEPRLEKNRVLSKQNSANNDD